MSDSDSDDEDFCLFGMKGPIIVCEEDEVQATTVPEAEMSLTILQHLELCFLRKDEHAVKCLSRGAATLTALQHQTIDMVLSLFRGEYVSLITSSLAPLPMAHLCQLSNIYRGTGEVPDNIRHLAFMFIADGQASDSSPEDAAWRGFQVLVLGSAYQHLFCQVNYTGPELGQEEAEVLVNAVGEGGEAALVLSVPVTASDTPSTLSLCSLGESIASGKDQLPSDSTTKKTDLSVLHSKAVLRALESDGNYPFALCSVPLLLLVARCLLRAVACPLRAGWQAGACQLPFRSFNSSHLHTRFLQVSLSVAVVTSPLPATMTSSM